MSDKDNTAIARYTALIMVGSLAGLFLLAWFMRKHLEY